MEAFTYPLNDFGPLMKGLVVGALGIFHVFVAQLAIGGGLLLCWFQWLAQTGRCPQARELLRSYFRFLVLVSFVLGALTGVGMWFITIQISPRTIGTMVSTFHWMWAIEWTFFCLEIASGYLYYRYSERLDDRGRMILLVLYSIAAWFSLFWVNGILSWQLTPGEWLRTRDVWDGFFNPSFWPSLVFRTIVSMTLAALASCVVINTLRGLDRDGRRVLIHRAAWFLAPMALLPAIAVWYFLSVPADSRSWVLGGSAAMTLFLTLGAGASLLIGLYAAAGILLRRLYINGITASLLCALALGATAGGEFVREGIRKPFTIRGLLYSNSIAPGEIATLRRSGGAGVDPWPLRDAAAYPNEQVRLGAQTLRNQCAVCHTLSGMNGLLHLTGTWTVEQMQLNIAQLQRTKPFMPPFAGSAEEVQALVLMLDWSRGGRPLSWPEATGDGQLDRIRRWLEEAGTEAGIDVPGDGSARQRSGR